jgi:hypothetical protein
MVSSRRDEVLVAENLHMYTHGWKQAEKRMGRIWGGEVEEKSKKSVSKMCWCLVCSRSHVLSVVC